jgi:hypothetical protein
MRHNASQSAALAMKLQKMLSREFEPHFSAKHMLKDMQIANQIGLSHYLDLGVTAAARDQLLEQMHWGHGDDDYSVVARKYLHETAPVGGDELQLGEEEELTDVGEPVAGSAEVEAVSQQDAAPQASSEPSVGAPTAAVGNQGTQLRRGLFKHLRRRSSGEK